MFLSVTCHSHELFEFFTTHRNARSQIGSCAQPLAATYSDSVEERATVGCFLLAQLITPPHREMHCRIVILGQWDWFPNLHQCNQLE